jgi:tetratricopeptide (TPR) repeat protein
MIGQPQKPFEEASMSRAIPVLLAVLLALAGCTSMKAGLALHEKDYPAALALYQEALAKEPDSLHLQNQVGLTRFRMKDYDKAQATFERVLAQSPKEPFATLYLGLCFIGKSERKRGLDTVSTYSVPFKFFASQAVTEEAEKLRARPDLANDVVIRRIEEAVERGEREQLEADAKAPNAKEPYGWGRWPR